VDRAAKITTWILPALLLIGAAAWFQPAVAGADLFWHLAAGRDIWARGAVPGVDPFSYTFQGSVWMNHEWLWDVLYWAIYRIHPEAVAWFNLAVLASVFGCALERARRISGSIWAAGAAVWIAAACAHWYLDIRPHLFTLLLLHVLLLTFEKRWAPWLWPALMIVWANLHGGFVFAFGAIGLHVVVRTLEESVRARRLVVLRREWLGVLLCIPAMLANPWGYKILEYPLAYLPLPGKEPSPYSSILEWRPAGFGLEILRYRGLGWLSTFQGGFWIAVAATLPGALLALLPRRRNLYAVALAAVTLAMALSARRFIPLFAVTAAPLMALGFAAVLERLRARWPALAGSGVQLAASALLAGVVLLLWQDVKLRPDFLRRWTQGDTFPVAAARVLDSLGPVRVFNYYNWGGYIMLHAPEARVFIDGRANTLYDDAMYNLYVRTLGNPAKGVRRSLAKYPADVALVRARGPLMRGLRSQARPWKLVYLDARAALLISPTALQSGLEIPPLPELLADEPQYQLERIRALAVRGEVDDALERLDALLERDPLLSAAWNLRINLVATRDGVEAANAVVEDAIRATPRRQTNFRASQARMLRRLGYKREALEADRRGMRGDPFGQPERDVKRLRKLERTLSDEA